MSKYLYGWKLYVNYGRGWEYEVFEQTLKKIKQRAKEYRENTPYPVKFSSGRELKSDKIKVADIKCPVCRYESKRPQNIEDFQCPYCSWTAS